jgi:chitodextrinase
VLRDFIVFFVLFIPAGLFSQTDELIFIPDKPHGIKNAEYFDFVMVNDFENNTIGYYNEAEWMRDWNNPPWANRLENALIYPKEGNKVLRLDYLEGTFGLNADDETDPGDGIQFFAPLPGEIIEIYFSYNIMFRPNFDFVISGKLPGLDGGPEFSAGSMPTYEQGFKCGLAWSGQLYSTSLEGTIAFYLYHHDMPGAYGQIYTWADPYSDDKYYKFKTDAERWTNITIRLVLNTVNGGGLPGNYDGFVEGFINGKLMSQWTGLRMRNVSDVKIDFAKIYSFFGGDTPAFAARRDEWALFDDFYLFTYAPGVDVPRGYTHSSPGRELILPNLPGSIPVDVEPPPPDTEAPSVPDGLNATAVSASDITVKWNASSDNVAVTGYRVFLDNIFKNATTSTTHSFPGLTAGATYSISVSAIDAAGNQSAKCTPIAVTTIDVDTDPPSVPSGLVALVVTDNFVSFKWDASTDNSAVSGYRIFRDGTEVGTSVSPTFTVGGLNPSTSYSFNVTAFDPKGNESAQSEPLEVTTSVPDTSPPTVPGNLVPISVGEDYIVVSWTPSEDDNSLGGYRVFSNDLFKGNSLTNSFTLSNLSAGFTYTIEVSAFDLSSNESERSVPLKVSTNKPPDQITAPSLPEVEVLDINNSQESASMVSEMTLLGHTEVEDFGVLISEDLDQLHRGRIIYSSPDSSEVESSGRVVKNLQVLYNFSEGSGQVVKDISNTGTPLDLDILNPLNTKWLPGQGLKLYGNATIESPGVPEDLIDALQSTNEITIEVWIKSTNIVQTGPARIISISSGRFNRGITLGQTSTTVTYDYIARLNTSSTNENGLPEVSSNINFTYLNLHHLVFTFDQYGTERLYVNNNMVYEGTRQGDFSTWEEGYKFLLGNETSGDRPWEGIYYLAAVYNRALSSDEVKQNFNAGIGDIQYTTRLTGLEPNVSYYVAPFVRTLEGVVYGDPEEIVLESVLHPPKDDSLYMGIYPNPSDGNFNLFLKKQDLKVTKGFIRIADLAGQVLYHEDLTWPSGDIDLTISLSLDPIIKDGFYSLMFVAGDISTTSKLLIQK